MKTHTIHVVEAECDFMAGPITTPPRQTTEQMTPQQIIDFLDSHAPGKYEHLTVAKVLKKLRRGYNAIIFSPTKVGFGILVQNAQIAPLH